MRSIPATLAVIALAAVAGCRPNAVWSPDGKSLALSVKGQILTFDRASKRFKTHTAGPLQCLNPVWSPDSKRVVYYRFTVKDDNAVSMDLMSLDPATGKAAALAPKLPVADKDEPPLSLVREIVTADWRPAGKQLAYTAFKGRDSQVWIANADGAAAKPLATGPGSANHPVWSPDGKRIAYFISAPKPAGAAAKQEGGGIKGQMGLEVINADGTGRRRLWDADKLGPLALFGPTPAWSADGKSLTVVTERGKSDDQPVAPHSEVWTVGLDGAKPRSLAKVDAPCTLLTLGPRGCVYLAQAEENTDGLPRLLLAGPNLANPKTLLKITPELVRSKQGEKQDIEDFPIPVLSADGSAVAFSVVPKEGPASLIIQPTAGGQPESIEIPLPKP